MEHIKTVVCRNCSSVSVIVVVCSCQACVLTRVDLAIARNTPIDLDQDVDYPSTIEPTDASSD